MQGQISIFADAGIPLVTPPSATRDAASIANAVANATGIEQLTIQVFEDLLRQGGFVQGLGGATLAA